MEKSAEEANKAIQKYYPNLLKVLPINELAERFFSGRLLSYDQKSKLDSLPSCKEKIAYFLDEMLIPGLSMNYTKHFDEMITMMKESDDALARHLVELIDKELMPTTVVSPTSPTTSVTTDTESTPVEFSVTEKMHNAFSRLMVKFTVESNRPPPYGQNLAVMKVLCNNYCDTHYHENPDFISSVSSMDDFFSKIIEPQYCNFLNLGLLEYLAESADNECLKTSVKNYDNTFWNVQIKKELKSVGIGYKVKAIRSGSRAKEYEIMFIKLIKKGITYGRVKQIKVQIRSGIICIQPNSLILKWYREGSVCLDPEQSTPPPRSAASPQGFIPTGPRADLSLDDVNEVFMSSSAPSPDVRVAMMGSEGAGKTCLVDTLTDKDFKNTSPTKGVDEMEVIVTNAVDWSVLTKEEMIDNLQEQVLQELKHCTAQQSQPVQDFSTSTTKSAPLALSPKAKSITPSLPNLELPSGDKMYFLTIEEFKRLPSIIGKYDPLRKYLNIWDYAGQQVFQHTHGLFVSEEVVCLIVFDASKLLDEVPERRYEGDKSPARSGLHTITYYMDLISCRVSKKSTSDSDLSEFLPTFILVGTKIDTLSTDINEAEEIAYQRFVPILQEKLAGKPFAKHIAGSKKGQLFTRGSPSVYFLSNRLRNPKVVAELQRVILQAAPERNRPTRLVKMERKLMLLSHKDKLSVINMEQVKEVAKSCGISPDGEGVLAVLKFFHQKGTLLYFHQVPTLSNVIILSPQWLAKLLTYVLTNLLCQPAGPPLAQYAEERNKKGLLRQELINFCIDQFLDEENGKGCNVPELKGNNVADLLLKFKLMADVTDTSLATKISSSKNRVYFVPHLLPVQQFVPFAGPCYKVFYLFPGCFIPDNLLDQLIVKCAEWNKMHKFGFLRLAYQWVSMRLGLHQSYQLRPIHKKDLIELTIVSNPKMSQEEEMTALTNTNELITVVKMFIDDLMKESMMATFEQYPVECYLPCPATACSEVHIKMEEIKETSSTICPISGEFIDMEEYHKLLTFAITSSDTEESVENYSDCSTARATIQEQYDQLIRLPVNSLLPSLYARNVVTFDQKEEIEELPHKKKRMEFVLNLIIRSLDMGISSLYNGFLKVLKKRQDFLTRKLAKKLAPPVLATTDH